MKTTKTKENSQPTCGKTRKTISYTLVAAMLHASVAPAIAAEGQRRQHAQTQQTQTNTADSAVTQMMELAAKHELNLGFIKDAETTRKANQSIATKVVDGVKTLFVDSSAEQAVGTAQEGLTTQIISLEAQMHTEHAKLMHELSAQIQDYQSKQMPRSVFTDQQALILELNKRHKHLTGLIHKLKHAKSDKHKRSALNTLNKQLKQWQPKTSPTDMENLPWGTPKNDVRELIVADHASINKVHYALPKKTKKHTAIGQWRETEYNIGTYLLNQNPIQPIAGINGQTQAGRWAVLKALPAQVQEKDLSETQDIQINQDIKKLAKKLDHSPAKIYKWVHDNIEYIPTYGSIQGSAFTLETKRGNATDTASLLIALLRASKVPARYVYGTVDIPAKHAMDWVGGVNTLDAAQNLLGQGGVPNKALMHGSVPKYLRLEHVWVEANVDWISSRGSLSANKTKNSAKQWIPLDASYKSYTRTKGIDLAKAVPFDAKKLIEDAKQGAIINEKEGSVKNLNQQAINKALKDYQAKVKTYLEQNHPKATVGDVLGTDKINPYRSTMLAPMLPYKVKTVIADYQELPDSMRHYFLLQTYPSASSLYGSSVDYSSPIMNVKIPTTQLQGKPLAFSFKPANEAEEKKLTSLLPKDEKGTLPSSLPTNISMSPELTLNGETLQSKGTHRLGHTVKMRYGIQSPNSSLPSMVNKDITAGEYHAIGYNLQGMSQKQLERTKKTLEGTKATLEKYKNSKDKAVLSGLTKHGLTGAMLQANVQSYFAVNQVQDDIQTKQSNIVQNYYMSFGTFSTSFTTYDRYGIPWKTAPKGLMMDIDRILHQTVNINNTKEELINYLKAQGVRESANEHIIPEKLFDNPNTIEKETKGVSAVKVLNIANQQKQKIYTFTKEKQAEILPKLSAHSAKTLSDVRNGLNAGKQITISEKPINFNGWKGAGYIVLDLNDGTGAYLIEGGADGSAIVDFFYDYLVPFLSLYSMGLAFAPGVLPFLGLILAITLLFASIMNYFITSSGKCDSVAGYLYGGAGGFTLLGGLVSNPKRVAALFFGAFLIEGGTSGLCASLDSNL